MGGVFLNDNLKENEIEQMINKFYNDDINAKSTIMYNHVNNALKEMYDKYGITQFNDVYRILSYVVLRIFIASSENEISKSLQETINAKAYNIVENIIKEVKDDSNGKDIAFCIPAMMMDILAYKEFIFREFENTEKTEDLENE